MMYNILYMTNGNPRSIQALGGTGRKFTVEDPHLNRGVQQVLNSTPSTIIRIALDSSSQLQEALAYLVNENIFNTTQYDLLAKAIIELAPEGVPQTGIVDIIVKRTSVDTTRAVRDILGWNAIGADGSLDFLG